MNKCIEISYGMEQISSVVSEVLLPLFVKKRVSVVLLFGTLGSGKTTLVKELVAQLGVEEVVTSPTFNYVNVYEGKRIEIQHFDLYRLGSWGDVEELGLHERIGAVGTLSFIEWPEIVEDVLENLSVSCGIIRLYLSYDQSDLSIRTMKIVFEG